MIELERAFAMKKEARTVREGKRERRVGGHARQQWLARELTSVILVLQPDIFARLALTVMKDVKVGERMASACLDGGAFIGVSTELFVERADIAKSGM